MGKSAGATFLRRIEGGAELLAKMGRGGEKMFEPMGCQNTVKSTRLNRLLVSINLRIVSSSLWYYVLFYFSLSIFLRG